MNFYESHNVVKNYIEEVKNHLISNHAFDEAKADALITESSLSSCIEGCPYIAMHYPAENTADRLAKADGSAHFASAHHKSEHAHQTV